MRLEKIFDWKHSNPLVGYGVKVGGTISYHLLLIFPPPPPLPFQLEEMICGVQEDLYFLLNSKILPMAIKSLISY